MRRAALALLGTAIGTSLLVGAKLGTPTRAGVPDIAAVAADSGGAGTAVDEGSPEQEPEDPSAEVTASAGATPAAAATATPSKGAPKNTAPAGTKTTRPTAQPKTTSPNPSAAGGLKAGTFAGAPSTNEYGTIKVTITVSGGKITNVAATYPTSPSRTASINSNAIPKLRQEALNAQSAKIDTVSGATYTSGSYRISLQSALDQTKA